MSAKQSRESLGCLSTQLLTLQADMSNFEKQFELKMVALDHKLRKVEENVQAAGTCWRLQKELFELELGDAKVVAVQKIAEASCIFAKFEEAQDIMKEADIMINELMIANETLKLEIEGMKKMEFASDMMSMKKLVLELEDVVAQVQTTFEEDFISLTSEFLCMKSQLQDSSKSMRSWLEDIWSEIIVKDCASWNRLAIQKANIEKEQISCCTVLENFKKEIILLTVDAELEKWILLDNEVEVALVQKEVEKAQRERQNLLLELDQSNSRNTHMDKVNKALEQDIQLLKDAACLSDNLKVELGEVLEAKMRLSSQVQKLEADYQILLEGMKTNERSLATSSSRISVLDQQNQVLQNDICLLEASLCKLQAELDMKDLELSKMSCLVVVNESLESEVKKLKADHSVVLQDLEEKKSELESSLSRINVVDMENQILQDKIHSLETSTGSLQTHLDMVNAELNKLRLSESFIEDELCTKSRDLQIHVERFNSLKEENVSLRNKLRCHEKSKSEFLTMFELEHTEVC
ncbi:hypothetical protein F0562_020649 [Nyssa sinensis]|uniref:Uncharacterized protein n=1 Tax=Nyssa sinensis TaxID=561372 RepID=A0A5J5BUZ6_9ASTE|nr:hypothetical protein F0562_020649 [Nyssa sinensis]